LPQKTLFAATLRFLATTFVTAKNDISCNDSEGKYYIKYKHTSFFHFLGFNKESGYQRNSHTLNDKKHIIASCGYATNFFHFYK
jgi:hypothetical protein